MGETTKSAEEPKLTLEDLRAMEPVDHKYGLVGRIVVDLKMEAHVTEESFNPDEGTYVFTYDLHKAGELLGKGNKSFPEKDAALSFMFAFLMDYDANQGLKKQEAPKPNDAPQNNG